MLQVAGRTWRAGVLLTALVVTASAVGCSKSQPAEGADGGGLAAAGAAGGPASASAIASTPQQAPAAPSGSVASAAPLERVMVPMKLVLKGPTPPPEKGEFKLAVDIVANEPLLNPLVMRIELPAGAHLVKGAREESLTIKQIGTTTKEFTIRIDGPLTTPITVTAEMKDEAGGAGMRAQRRYPTAADGAASSSASPPATRPPVIPR